MGFLLKVKRAKFALDKARRWMWKVLFLSLFFLHVILDMVIHLLMKADSSSLQTRKYRVSKAMNTMPLLLSYNWDIVLTFSRVEVMRQIAASITG